MIDPKPLARARVVTYRPAPNGMGGKEGRAWDEAMQAVRDALDGDVYRRRIELDPEVTLCDVVGALCDVGVRSLPRCIKNPGHKGDHESCSGERWPQDAEPEEKTGQTVVAVREELTEARRLSAVRANERDGLYRTLSAVREELTEARATSRTVANERDDLCTRLEFLQFRYDAGGPYIKGLETRVRVAEEDRARLRDELERLESEGGPCPTFDKWLGKGNKPTDYPRKSSALGPGERVVDISTVLRYMRAAWVAAGKNGRAVVDELRDELEKWPDDVAEAIGRCENGEDVLDACRAMRVALESYGKTSESLAAENKRSIARIAELEGMLRAGSEEMPKDRTLVRGPIYFCPPHSWRKHSSAAGGRLADRDSTGVVCGRCDKYEPHALGHDDSCVEWCEACRIERQMRADTPIRHPLDIFLELARRAGIPESAFDSATLGEMRRLCDKET